MAPSRYIYLAPNFADQSVEDEHDDWVEFPGRIVAGVLQEIMQGLGCKLDRVESEDGKRREFNFQCEGVRMWTRVGAIEDFLIALTPHGG